MKDLSHNMLPVILNISVKFPEDIPYSKEYTDQTSNFQSTKGDNS